MITKLNNEVFRNEIRPELDKVLAEVGKKLGINFVTGRITYSNDTFKFSTDAVLTNGTPGMSVEVAEWNKNYAKYGMEKDDIGKVFNLNKGTYKITGLKCRNRKYPVLVMRVLDGRSYKFSPYQVKLALGRKI